MKRRARRRKASERRSAKSAKSSKTSARTSRSSTTVLDGLVAGGVSPRRLARSCLSLLSNTADRLHRERHQPLFFVLVVREPLERRQRLRGWRPDVAEYVNRFQ